MDFAIEKIKEKEKMNKYLDLARELKHEGDGNITRNWHKWNNP